MPECTLCAGELTELGTLGRLTHYRCRDCGGESSAPAESPTIGPNALLTRGERYSAALARMARRGYYLADGHGGEYSANAGDYWDSPDTSPIGALVKRVHLWRTVTGESVYSARLLKSAATVRDLRRLARAAGLGV